MKPGGIYAALAVVVLAACGGTTIPAIQPGGLSGGTGLPAQLPDVATLDALHHASDTQSIDVTAPLLSDGTEVAGADLAFASPADGASWAIYEVVPDTEQVAQVNGETSGPLWLLVADYGSDSWYWSTPPNDADTRVMLGSQGLDVVSGGGYVYLAVVCPPDSSALLHGLVLHNAGVVPAPILNTTLPDRIVVSWLDSGIYDYFEVYRSTIPNDPAPYLVYTQDSEILFPDFGEWFFNDMVNLDGEEWVPRERDHGTPEEASDDYPSLAPGVQYYYRIVPYFGPGNAGTVSAEVAGSLPWDGRRSTRRVPPATTTEILVFADQLLPNQMTAAQVQWCAENLVGTQKIFKWQADEFRQYNPDFMVAGYHLGNGAGEIGNVHGDDWDSDADWPYVNNHEDWFIHRPASTQPNQRVYQTTWAWYVADPQSAWQDYLAANLVQMLGEDHFDGWFIDSCHQPWGTDPAQWWPDEQTMFGYWTPRLEEMLKTVTERAKAHPLQPYVVANAGSYITTASDIKYYGDDWACDGIMIEGHARTTPGEYFSEADWVLQHDRILDHQAQGLATILQTYIFTPDSEDRIFVMASYFLVKGDYTYINWLGDDGLDTIWPSIGQWYPEFDLDEDDFPWGAATGETPQTMADLHVAAYDGGGDVICGPFYRRSYGIGFVLVNPGETAVSYRAPYHMSYLSVEGGGNITPAGEKTGSYTWEMLGMGEVRVLQPHTALIIRDVFG